MADVQPSGMGGMGMSAARKERKEGDVGLIRQMGIELMADRISLRFVIWGKRGGVARTIPTPEEVS